MAATDKTVKKVNRAFLAAALLSCLLIFGCSSSTAVSGAGSSHIKEGFDAAPTTIAGAEIYGPGETVGIDAAESHGGAEAFSVGFPSIERSSTLPEGISLDSFFPGFDADSISSRKNNYGYTINADGSLSEGFSYALVTVSISDRSGQGGKCDCGRMYFSNLDNTSNQVKDIGGEPLWRSNWDGQNKNRYYMVQVPADGSISLSMLYVLPDSLAADRLLFIPNEGVNKGDGIQGVKAFDVTDQWK